MMPLKGPMPFIWNDIPSPTPHQCTVGLVMKVRLGLWSISLICKRTANLWIHTLCYWV